MTVARAVLGATIALALVPVTLASPLVPPPGGDANDPWLDADGDSLFGNLNVGAHALLFSDRSLESPSVGELWWNGAKVCVVSDSACAGVPGPKGDKGDPGPAGAPGPAGPSSFVAMSSTSGAVSAPSANSSWLTPRAVAVVSAGDVAHVTANAAFGSQANGGGADLRIFPCYQLAGGAGPLLRIGGGMFGLTAPQGHRSTFGVSGVAQGLPAGTYEFGMCGYSTSPATWNNNEWGYASVIVARASASGAATAPAAAPGDAKGVEPR